MGDEDMPNKDRRKPFRKRLAWFVGLWAAGVAVVAAFSYLIRWLLAP